MICPECRTIVPIASQNGTTKMTRIAVVITATASARLFHSFDCKLCNSGHVAMASIVAQIIAGRKGFRIQRLPPIRAAMNRMAKVVRVRSLPTLAMAKLPCFART